MRRIRRDDTPFLVTELLHGLAHAAEEDHGPAHDACLQALHAYAFPRLAAGGPPPPPAPAVPADGPFGRPQPPGAPRPGRRRPRGASGRCGDRSRRRRASSRPRAPRLPRARRGGAAGSAGTARTCHREARGATRRLPCPLRCHAYATLRVPRCVSCSAKPFVGGTFTERLRKLAAHAQSKADGTEQAHRAHRKLLRWLKQRYSTILGDVPEPPSETALVEESNEDDASEGEEGALVVVAPTDKAWPEDLRRTSSLTEAMFHPLSLIHISEPTRPY